MKLIKTLTAAAAICCAAITSQASLTLAAGGSGSLGAALSVAGGATLVTSLLLQPLSPPGQTLQGSVSTFVYSGDANNSLGGYTFEYVLTSSSLSTDDIARWTLNGWAGLSSVIVGNVSGSAAATGDRTANGNTVGFQYFVSSPANPGVPIGGTSTVIVQTGISQWAPSTATLIDGSSPVVSILAVPEPTTMIAGALLLLPFGASTLRFVRKSRQA
jgi:hypothetical protein